MKIEMTDYCIRIVRQGVFITALPLANWPDVSDASTVLHEKDQSEACSLDRQDA